MNGSVVIGSATIPDKEDLCEAFLGKVPNKFQDGWIDMKWLENNFKELPPNATDIVKEQYAQGFILRLIEGILMLDKTQNLVHIRWLLHLVNFKECKRLIMGVVSATISTSPSEQSLYVLTDDKLKDIWLPLDQHLEAEFEWILYADPDIIECVSSRNFGHSEYVRHECAIDCLCDDGYAQIELSDAAVQGKIDENWQDYHNEYIDIWDRRMKFLPIHEPFFLSYTVTYLEYMPWFRVTGKPYLLSVEAKSRQLRPKRSRQSP
ncbi:hypothetical protein CXB51_033830 [Gossypium anomalum]|uniref:Uncharacterized protein n=1 Tax=Gossypium anomalum TaxID=47600 RepID=A0A8J5XQD1_9ROSI|nr:hypothetical protein CXB51_033830 [Gossypium anomalum]